MQVWKWYKKAHLLLMGEMHIVPRICFEIMEVG